MKKKLLVIFILSFLITYLFICFGFPGMQLKLEAEPLELFVKSIKHMFLFKSIVSLVVAIVICFIANKLSKK
ncbi:MAG: hypothetical protein Q4E33_05555 [Erysipelotrichaceae bacterium]|nr:hypothetical protein [Erysipelotrichaceae bacterium]